MVNLPDSFMRPSMYVEVIKPGVGVIAVGMLLGVLSPVPEECPMAVIERDDTGFLDYWPITWCRVTKERSL